MDELRKERLIPNDAVFMVPPVEIGHHTYIGENTHISQLTTIGKFCGIGNLCTIGAQPHRTDFLTNYPLDMLHGRTESKAKPTVIGNDVWIGSNAVIMGGLTVGDGAVVGAGSVVTKNVEPYAIVAGNPARVLRYRFPQWIVEILLEAKWWDFPLDEIKSLPMQDIALCMTRLRSIKAVAYYARLEEAEQAALEYDRKKKVKTDVFRVKKNPHRGFYVEQDIA